MFRWHQEYILRATKRQWLWLMLIVWIPWCSELIYWLALDWLWCRGTMKDRWVVNLPQPRKGSFLFTVRLWWQMQHKSHLMGNKGIFPSVVIKKTSFFQEEGGGGTKVQHIQHKPHGMQFGRMTFSREDFSILKWLYVFDSVFSEWATKRHRQGRTVRFHIVRCNGPGVGQPHEL